MQKTAREDLVDQAYKRKNRWCRHLLRGTILISVILLTLVLKLSASRITSSMTKNIEEYGNTAQVELDQANAAAEAAFSGSAEVRKIGRIYDLGTFADHEQVYARCVYADPATFGTMIQPAFLHFYGTYPQNRSEVLLSTETLRYLGIKQPKIGMTVSADFYWKDLFHEPGTGRQSFRLSGYYDALSDSSLVYLPAQTKEEGNIGNFPCTLLLELTNPFLSEDEMDQVVSRILPDQLIQSTSTDSALRKALVDLAGGMELTAILFLVICLLTFFLINQMMSAAYKEHVRFWGLMKVLGVSNHQFRTVLKRDALKSGLISCAAGEGFCFFTFFLSSRIASDHNRIAVLQPDLRVDVGIFLFVLLLILVSLALPCALVQKQVTSVSPLSAMSYLGEKGKSTSPARKAKFRYSRSIPLQIAVMRIYQEKKKVIRTIICLFIGCVTALISISLAQGADYRNAFSSVPDFTVRVTQKSCTYMRENLQEGESNQLLDKDFIDILHKQVDAPWKKVDRVKGYLPSLDTDENSVLGVMKQDQNTQIVIQPVAKTTLKKLCQMEEASGNKVDESALMQRGGAIVLSKHLQYADSQEIAQANLGRRIPVYDTLPDGAEVDRYRSGQLVLAGYADMTKRGSPKISMAWDGENTLVLAVTPDTYRWLGEFMREQVLSVSFSTGPKLEDHSKKQLAAWIRDENYRNAMKKGLSNLDLLEYKAKSDLLADNRAYINFSRMAMGGISAVCLVLGIMVFLSALLSEPVRNRQENHLLHCLGVTRKELTKASMLKGLFYFVSLLLLLSTVGIWLLHLAGRLIKIGLPYFVYAFPTSVFWTMLGLLFTLTVLVPLLLKKIENTGDYHGC